MKKLLAALALCVGTAAFATDEQKQNKPKDEKAQQAPSAGQIEGPELLEATDLNLQDRLDGDKATGGSGTAVEKAEKKAEKAEKKAEKKLEKAEDKAMGGSGTAGEKAEKKMEKAGDKAEKSMDKAGHKAEEMGDKAEQKMNQ